MLEWADDLKISNADLYLDSRQPRSCCFISHAHSDHICRHDKTICTPATATLTAHRLRFAEPTGEEDSSAGDAVATIPDCALALPYRERFDLDSDTLLRLFPAGHVLGSAMLHVTRPEGSLLYTGDVKLRQSRTCEPAEIVTADYLVTESTYGLPEFQFPDPRELAERLCELAEQSFKDNRQPIVMGYSLGKAQEISRTLTEAGFAVTQHGAAYNITEIYQSLGVAVGAVRRYRFGDFHGADQLDLRERGVLVAPPYVARTPFVTRFSNPCRIIMTGWALQKNAIYRYGVDHALPLSDHADFGELLELIDRVRPRKIFTHHGYPEFVDQLKMRGFNAQLARPADQLSLFES
jgi:Cft2 family RNA processing exonuclease